MFWAVLIAAGCMAALIAAVLRQRNEEQEEPEPLIDSAALIAEIERLHRRAQELAQLDDMIIDIRLCDPEKVQRGFRISWQSTSGAAHEYDVMADGKSVGTARLLEMAAAERAEVNEEIISLIYDLYARACAIDAKNRGDAV